MQSNPLRCKACGSKVAVSYLPLDEEMNDLVKKCTRLSGASGRDTIVAALRVLVTLLDLRTVASQIGQLNREVKDEKDNLDFTKYPDGIDNSYELPVGWRDMAMGARDESGSDSGESEGNSAGVVAC